MDPIKLETPIGPIEIKPQGKDTSEGNEGSDILFVNLSPDLPEVTNCVRYSQVIIRGIAYRGSMHLWRWSDGLFHVGREWHINKSCDGTKTKTLATKWDHRDSMSLRRPQMPYGKDEASSSAKEYAQKAVEAAVNAIIGPRPYLLLFAESERLESVIERLEGKARDTRKELLSIELEIRETIQALEAIEKQKVSIGI